MINQISDIRAKSIAIKNQIRKQIFLKTTLLRRLRLIHKYGEAYRTQKSFVSHRHFNTSALLILKNVLSGILQPVMTEL